MKSVRSMKSDLDQQFTLLITALRKISIPVLRKNVVQGTSTICSDLHEGGNLQRYWRYSRVMAVSRVTPETIAKERMWTIGEIALQLVWDQSGFSGIVDRLN